MTGPGSITQLIKIAKEEDFSYIPSQLLRVTHNTEILRKTTRASKPFKKSRKRKLTTTPLPNTEMGSLENNII